VKIASRSQSTNSRKSFDPGEQLVQQDEAWATDHAGDPAVVVVGGDPRQHRQVQRNRALARGQALQAGRRRRRPGGKIGKTSASGWGAAPVAIGSSAMLNAIKSSGTQF
jgi:hypothetical protein